MTSAGRVRAQGLTEGAILAALVAIFAVASRYLPILSIATTFLCPVPIAVLVIRHGLRVAAIASVVSVLVGTVIAGPVIGLIILVAFAPMGIVIGIGARRNWPAVRTVAIGALTASASTAMSFLGLLGGGRLSVAEMAESAKRSATMAADLYARMGVPKAQIDAVMQQQLQIAELFPYLLPLMLVGGAAMTSWLDYEVGRRVLARFGYRLNLLPPLRTWRIPPAGVWFVPFGFLALWVGTRLGLSPMRDVGLSVMMGSLGLFALQGMIAGWVILGNYGFGKFERIIAVVLTLSLQQLTSVPLFILGMLDSMMQARDRWGVERPRAARAKP